MVPGKLLNDFSLCKLEYYGSLILLFQLLAINSALDLLL